MVPCVYHSLESILHANYTSQVCRRIKRGNTEGRKEGTNGGRFKQELYCTRVNFFFVWATSKNTTFFTCIIHDLTFSGARANEHFAPRGMVLLRPSRFSLPPKQTPWTGCIVSQSITVTACLTPPYCPTARKHYRCSVGSNEWDFQNLTVFYQLPTTAGITAVFDRGETTERPPVVQYTAVPKHNSFTR